MRSLIYAICLCVTTFVAADDAFDYAHGVSYIEPLKYPADFEHFEYVNPHAPMGGTIRIPEMGTYDSFNGIIDKGRVALGFWRLGATSLIYDRLLERSLDEPASAYSRLAEGVWVSDDFKAFAFKIRGDAYWHDGTPLTIDDVIFTFETLQEKGAAGVRSALGELGSIERISDNEVLFRTKPESVANPDLIFVIGDYAILPKHYWQDRDISKTTVIPPLGSGPYKMARFEMGRNLVLERVKDYWGDRLPVNVGRHNWENMKIDYFKDESVQLEALKGDVIDIRSETVSKNWTTQYEFPAVKNGYLNKELVDIARPWGLWAPIQWNVERPYLADVRVREALWLMSEFRWTNRVLMYGFYNYSKSFFYNSPMASSGLPSERELKLLEPWRGQIPDRVFTTEFNGNETTGYGFDRDNVKRAIELMKEAGWEIRDGRMTNIETGEPYPTLDLVFNSPYSMRQETPLARMLNMIGIRTSLRTLEVSNWLFRMRNDQFDGTCHNFEPPNIPGIMLRNRLGSASADTPGGQNWSNIRDPAVDAMIDHVMAAREPEELYAATRALDRIMLWNFYYINGLGSPGYRLVYWDKFDQPQFDFRLQRSGWIDTWWYDEAKAENVRVGMAKLTGR